MSRGKMVETENIPRKISYQVGHSRVSLDLPVNLKIHKLKNVKFEISNFSRFLPNISPFMGPRGKMVGAKNVSRKISYNVGHSRVSLDLAFKLEIY